METTKMYINGKFTDAIAGATRAIRNPANDAVIALVAEAQTEDAEMAILAARSAFDNGPWRKTSAQERGKLLLKLAANIRSHFEELVVIEVRNNGKPKREAEFDIEDAANCFEFYAGLATKIHGETMQVPANSFSYVLREPIGVCVQIIPWNYPLLMAAWKLAPALAAGNCCVLKPSELTPLSALRLAELINETGFPEGVVNIITGDGAVCGSALINHPSIDKIAFTGGTLTGKKIMEAASKNLKRVTLELGGKNPAIFFDDCDMDLAIDWGLFAAFANQGQVCSAGSRLLIQDTIYDEFMKRFLNKIPDIKIGYGMAEGTAMGPLISKAHREKVEAYIRLGLEEGATLIAGGTRPTDEALQDGYFLSPTVFAGVTNSMRIAKEEIFGPVCTLHRFTTEDEAIKLANDTEYGLAAGIFTRNLSLAHRFTQALRTGVVWVNNFQPTYNEMPWGGYKQSGIGRELGLYGIEAYLETKQVNINLDETPVGWY